jgi:hypothetical protein
MAKSLLGGEAARSRGTGCLIMKKLTLLRIQEEYEETMKKMWGIYED